MVAGCESAGPVENVATLSRVASPAGRFDAVFKRVDTRSGASDGFVYQVHIVTAGKPAESEPVLELRHLDTQSRVPFELEWQGDTKLIIRFGTAEVHNNKPSVQVADKKGKTERIEVAVNPPDKSPQQDDDSIGRLTL